MENQKGKYLKDFKHATGNSAHNNNDMKKFGSLVTLTSVRNMKLRQGLNMNQNGWMKSLIKQPLNNQNSESRRGKKGSRRRLIFVSPKDAM